MKRLQKFENALTQNGIQKPSSPIQDSSRNDDEFVLRMLAEICDSYPLHSVMPPALVKYMINIYCTKFGVVENVAKQCWKFVECAVKSAQNYPEVEVFNNVLEEALPTDAFVFWLITRNAVKKKKLGDDDQAGINLIDLTLNAEEWVAVASQIFAEYKKPTACVQHLWSRIEKSQYDHEIPADFFAKICVDEFLSMYNVNPLE